MRFRVGFLQFTPLRNAVEKNIEAIKHHLSGVQADLIVLPELSNSGYLYPSPASLEPFAEPCDESSLFLSSLKELAASTGGLIIAGYAEKSGMNLYNSAVAVSSSGILANYRKTHLFDKEKTLFQPGDTGFITVPYQGVSIGMMICFDWIFPESARTLMLAGAQIIAHPANLVLPYCQAAMIIRSIENRVFTITSNRIGKEQLGDSWLQFTGMSQVTDPVGNILLHAQKEETSLHLVEIDPEQALNKNITDRNNLILDRRPDFY